MQELLIRLRNNILFFLVLIVIPFPLFANKVNDTTSNSGIYKQVSLKLSPGYIFQTNPFFKGDNIYFKPLKSTFSTYIKYSFGYNNNSLQGKIYNGVYQGVGASFFTFGDKKEIGNPFSIFIFQGASIFNVNNYLSFNYEWNFGLSFNWVKYNKFNNEFNKVVGSNFNAYINVDFYLLWKLFKNINLTTGVGLSHFSNGNTSLPNAGLNTISFNIGVNYLFDNFNISKLREQYKRRSSFFNYDLTLYGAWRCKVITYNNDDIASPHKYLVLGFNFAPMYNIGYKFRTGISLDGLYDSSADIKIIGNINESNCEIINAPVKNRFALGLSARFEYVMPIFTIGAGIGTNVIRGGADLRSVYQLLYLKAYYVRRSYIHIGYSLHNFNAPNFLMLGLGITFGRINTVL